MNKTCIILQTNLNNTVPKISYMHIYAGLREVPKMYGTLSTALFYNKNTVRMNSRWIHTGEI